MYWSINPHTPKGYPRWRWVCVNLWRKLLFALGLHWKRRRVELTWYRFTRLVRGAMMERNERWDAILRQEPCVYCGRVLAFDKMTIEHVVPKSHGGVDTSLNKVGCCSTCNQRRGSKPLLHYLVERRYGGVSMARQRYLQSLRDERVAREKREMRKEKAQTLRVTMEETLAWKTQRIIEQDQKNRKPTDVDLRRVRG